jgi:hypothetical protein
MFNHYGCAQNTLINKPKLQDIFDKQSKNLRSSTFSPQIIDEFWGQSEAISKGQTTVLTIAKIIDEAVHILKDRISRIEGRDGISRHQ